MTKTYADIQKQIDALSREAERVKRKEMADVVARIKEAIQVYGLTVGDLGLKSVSGGNGVAARKGTKINVVKGSGAPKAKFRDEAGNTWGGRGPRPQWLRDALASGKKVEDFRV